MSDPNRESPADLEAAYFPRGGRPPSREVESGVTPHALPPQGILLPPDQYRPGQQSLEIYAISPIATSVGPGPLAVSASLIPTLIPASHVARLSTFGVQVLSMLASSVITFRLRINGGPVGAWGALQIPAAPLAVSQARFDIYEKVPKGALIDCVVQVDDAGSYVVQVYYAGWSYPAEYDALYAQGFGAAG